MFSARLINRGDSNMLNICDSDLLGKDIKNEKHLMHISKNFYGERLVDEDEAIGLLKNTNSINMVGRNIVSLSVKEGIGVQSGVKEIDGIPFLIVLKM